MRLLIVDLSSVAYPIWHASADKPIGAMYEGTVSRVRKAASGFDRAVIACDRPKCFRYALSPLYKAERRERPAAMLEQLHRIEHALAADGFTVLGVEGFEADDVVATVATWARTAPAPFADVEILSSDKDLLPLVATPGIFVRSANTGDMMGPVEVTKRFDLAHPALLRDLLALAGDKSDGVPGVRGVGPKHAATLLREHGNIDGIVAALDAMKPGAVRDAVRVAHADGSLELSRTLVTLRIDVPIDTASILAEPVIAAPDGEYGGDLDEDEDSTGGAAPATEAAPGRPSDEASHPGTTTETRDVQQGDRVVQEQVRVASAPTAESILKQLDPVSFERGLEPETMKQAAWMAEHAFASRLFPFASHDQVLMIIKSGRELGLPVMTSLRSFHVVEGRVRPSAHLIIGLVIRSGLSDYIEPVMSECDAQGATWRTKRVGRDEQRWRFTIEDARRAGVVKDKSNWDRRPAAMCLKQAGVELARAIYPDVCGNMYDPDEFGGDT